MLGPLPPATPQGHPMKLSRTDSWALARVLRSLLADTATPAQRELAESLAEKLDTFAAGTPPEQRARREGRLVDVEQRWPS